MSLEKALSSIVRVFNAHGIPYAVMGGLAVRVYAIPRFTNDVDLTIAIQREELPELIDSLQSIDCEVSQVYRDGWLDSVGGMPLFKADFYNESRSIEIDLFVSETPFQHSLIDRRRAIKTPDGEIWFVSPEDLILLKLIASRPRDLVDVQDILFTLGELDRGYLDHWGLKLSVAQELSEAFAQYDRENGEEA